jgi:hypothetical protein|tara:strand:- start:238 stop:411 length:174 start_codon:yes stop_codon:yes gene_type:complete
MFSNYQLDLIERSLSLLLSNYDEYDLEELMYTESELEAEVKLLQEKIKKEKELAIEP